MRCSAREELLQQLQASAGPGIRVVRAPCIGRCDTAPVGRGRSSFCRSCQRRQRACRGERRRYPFASARLSSITTPTSRPAAIALLGRLRSGELAREELLKALDDASLRGLGGAGFPTGRKWRSVLGEPGPRLMAVNGDEGEPGTFKDRYYLETDPHRFLEGMLIGAHVVEAADIYIYIRDEYPASREILDARDREIAAGRPAAASAARRRRLYLRRGILDAGKHRGQARPAAAQAALSVPGRAVRAADADQQHRDAVVGARHRRERAPTGGSVRPQRPSRPAQLFGVGPGQEARREAGARGHHRARTDRGILRRHGGRPRFPRLSARRRIGRHSAGVDGRHSARFRHAGEIRLLHRFRRGHRVVRAGRHRRRRAEPDAVLRGRELRPVHALPRPAPRRRRY